MLKPEFTTTEQISALPLSLPRRGEIIGGDCQLLTSHAKGFLGVYCTIIEICFTILILAVLTNINL